MEPNAEDLRRHYASLSDAALLAVERSDLTAIAQTCYDEELSKRDIVPGQVNRADGENEPDWIEESVSACSFDSGPGNNPAPDLDEARNILEAADIPCYVKLALRFASCWFRAGSTCRQPAFWIRNSSTRGSRLSGDPICKNFRMKISMP